jgi:mannan endo-1,4-beta-mannosidase
MFSLILLLIALPLFGIIYSYMPTPISPFLSSLSSLETTTSTSSSSSVGDLYWSLFGRTDDGCQYVQHDDSYTLHYPSDPSASSGAARGSGESAAMLTKHAWMTRGESPFWGRGFNFDVYKQKLEDLPVVAFPQEGLRLANGSIVGGS